METLFEVLKSNMVFEYTPHRSPHRCPCSHPLFLAPTTLPLPKPNIGNLPIPIPIPTIPCILWPVPNWN